MESLSPVSPSMVLPPNNALRPWRPQVVSSPLTSTNRLPRYPGLSCSGGRMIRRIAFHCKCKSKDAVGDPEEDDDGPEEVERALHLDGTIPSTSGEFVRRISSRAYDIRRHLQQIVDSSSYDVLEANPWREESKPVYVLMHNENRLCTMKTRRNRSEVERELGFLFSKGGKRRSGMGNRVTQSRPGNKFQMLVEDVREGLLVFEDENEAASYCDLLQGGGQGCEGVAEIEASSVFDLCRKTRALAVLFRRGRTPPLPQSLELNLRARKRSLEDQEDQM